jgi:hypothetical protein
MRAHVAEVQGLKEKIRELQAEVELSKSAEAAIGSRLDAAVRTSFPQRVFSW